METFFKKFGYTNCFTLGVILGLIIFSIGFFSYEIWFGRTIQTLNIKNHSATLRKTFGIIDYNLVVEVDGTRVYNSGDIFGISETQLRATLIWDTTGRVVAFEKMGKIYFVYDAHEKREIDEEELKKYCLSPMLEEYTKKNQSCKNQR